MRNNQPPKKKGMSSLEAAALYLSDGVTSDPNEAVHRVNGGNGLNIDELQKAHLRRMMGFDFNVKYDYKKLVVYSLESPLLSEEADFSGTWNEEDIDILVDTCLKLKEAWDAIKHPIEGEEVTTNE